jgi:hypothetical protein
VSDTIPTQHSRTLSRFTPIGFAIAGAVSRFEFAQVETRIHIIWFWVAALWVQFFVQSASRARVGVSLFVLNGAAATFAILLTKFALEGFPRYAAKALIGIF